MLIKSCCVLTELYDSEIDLFVITDLTYYYNSLEKEREEFYPHESVITREAIFEFAYKFGACPTCEILL